MSDWKHAWKIALILCLWLLASHWDYEESQRVRQAEYSARVANR